MLVFLDGFGIGFWFCSWFLVVTLVFGLDLVEVVGWVRSLGWVWVGFDRYGDVFGYGWWILSLVSGWIWVVFCLGPVGCFF